MRAGVWAQVLAHSSPQCPTVNACPFTVLALCQLGLSILTAMDWGREGGIPSGQFGCACPTCTRDNSCVAGMVACHMLSRSPSSNTPNMFHLLFTSSNSDHSDQHNQNNYLVIPLISSIQPNSCLCGHFLFEGKI